ncbi:MAG: TPM domain-containing protein [Bacteroidales bacterium]|nr:TPM domain-containing protein [Bacteroidales bacterium]
MMKKRTNKTLLLIILILVTVSMMAQVPAKPEPPRLVNDLAGIFSPEQQQQLEATLVEFSDSTSNQVVIVTVNDLGGLDKADFAYQIGDTWGVGQKKLNNGLVILIKPKNETNGQVFIASGYGLEGALPDAICKRIVQNEMIPYFRQNDYFGGVVAALRVIIPVAKGEYKYATSKKGTGAKGAVIAIILFIIFFIIISRKNNKNNGNFNGGGGNGSSGDLLSMILLGSMLSGRSHSGSWGGFSGGGGSSSGGGDFGGFGGGGFGGGGAGGSW